MTIKIRSPTREIEKLLQIYFLKLLKLYYTTIVVIIICNNLLNLIIICNIFQILLLHTYIHSKLYNLKFNFEAIYSIVRVILRSIV